MEKINCLLLVDDDKINNYLNERLLKELDFATSIRVVQNGIEALEYIGDYCSIEGDKCCPELVFLDINMPVMNGFEFLEEYNKLTIKKSTRIIVLTTSTNEADLRKIKELGIFEYINKPLTKNKILELFDNSISKI